MRKPINYRYILKAFRALEDLTYRADTTELIDGSSLDTAYAHAVLDELSMNFGIPYLRKDIQK